MDVFIITVAAVVWYLIGYVSMLVMFYVTTSWRPAPANVEDRVFIVVVAVLGPLATCCIVLLLVGYGLVKMTEKITGFIEKKISHKGYEE